MPRDASGRVIPGSYGPGRSGQDEQALNQFRGTSLDDYKFQEAINQGIGGTGINFDAAGTYPQIPRSYRVWPAMAGLEPADERLEPGSRLEDRELTEKYRQIQAAYPGVSQEEMDSIYQQYQKDLHFGQRQGEEPQRFEDWLQQHKSENSPQNETTSKLPPELQERIALGRGQQGPPMGGQYS